MSDAIPSRAAKFVVWEWWPNARSWQAMTLPLSMEDAIDIAGLSDAETCRILAAGDSPGPTIPTNHGGHSQDTLSPPGRYGSQP